MIVPSRSHFKARLGLKQNKIIVLRTRCPITQQTGLMACIVCSGHSSVSYLFDLQLPVLLDTWCFHLKKYLLFDDLFDDLNTPDFNMLAFTSLVNIQRLVSLPVKCDDSRCLAVLGQDQGLLSSSDYPCRFFYQVSLSEHDSHYV